MSLLALAVLVGCRDWQTGGGDLRIWAAPSGVQILPETTVELENGVFSDAERAVSLAGAINETVAFQLVFTGGPEAGSVWGVTVGDLRQDDRVIPAEQVRLYRQGLVEVEDYPSWYLRLTPETRRRRAFPDPLVPLTAPRGALPIDVPAGSSSAVWVEVRIPPSAEPGIYRSVVRVSRRSGLERQLDLVVRVWPFAIPQTHHLQLLAGVEHKALLHHHLEVEGRPYVPQRLSFDDPAYERGAAIIDATLQLLHDHRCTPLLTDLYPSHRLDAGGGVTWDWSDYDRLATGIVEGSLFADRTAAGVWLMPVNDVHPSPETYGGWGSAGYEQMLTDTLRECVRHFDERGWLDRHVVMMALPGPTSGARYERYERLGRVVQRADRRLRLFCPLPSHSMEPYGWVNHGYRDLSEWVTVWCPPARLADPAELASLRTRGKSTWLRPDQPPFAGSLAMIAPPSDARSVAWQAHRFGCDAVWLPTVTQWPREGEHDRSGTGLLWPGKPYGLDRPIPSIRLKRLHRGAQDYEYCWLLDRNRRPGIARLIAGDLVPGGGTLSYGEHFLDGWANAWVADPNAWSLARKLMARELLAAIASGDGEAASSNEDITAFERQLEWARLTKTVRQIRLRLEGVRLRVDPAVSGDALQVDATVSVFNATGKVAGGTLGFAELPDDWRQRAEASVAIGELAPSRTTRRVVRVEAPALETNLTGSLPVKLALTRAGDPVAETTGRLCLVTGQRLRRPPVIDGKLDDWPLGSRNVAGDFVLVGAADVPKRNRSYPDRPTHDTAVHVCCDRDYLYLGFRCDDDNLGARRIARDNYVKYDGLWPAQEDLVEVLLDPTNRAVGPADLLHVVVKANGAVVTERGVACLDQVAEHAEWPAGVIAAIDDTSQPNRWTVEIRIPLASLPTPASVWGVNFARYHARSGEYASWSGAPRHLYSPTALGNMRLER